jgi:beta-aspartyl-dipeptidase (metallo-type)
MMTLIRGGQVFAPEPLGPKDVLLAGGLIEAVAAPGSLRMDGVETEIIDATGKSITPGLIDPHVHILGGGGEGGPATRAPEIRIEDIVASGVTTVIGCLGTDGITRHMTSLLAKARALEAEGISTFLHAGSYEVPVQTLTGSIRSDLVVVDKVVGAGEIAVSDHRSSQPTFDEIARLAAECRVGGLLGGKAGVLHLHLGDGRRGLELLFRLSRETEIPVTQVIPTHISRNRPLFEQGLEWVAAGGAIDITVGPEPAPADPDVAFEEVLAAFERRGLPLTRITASSDSNGSMPVFDAAGRLVRLTIATESDLLRKLGETVRRGLLPLESALRIFSTNAADLYKLGRKGRIEPGRDADLLILDGAIGLVDVFARGRRMMAAGKVLAKGTFSV